MGWRTLNSIRGGLYWAPSIRFLDLPGLTCLLFCSMQRAATTTVPSPNTTVCRSLPQVRADLQPGLHHVHCEKGHGAAGARPRWLESWRTCRICAHPCNVRLRNQRSWLVESTTYTNEHSKDFTILEAMTVTWVSQGPDLGPNTNPILRWLSIFLAPWGRGLACPVAVSGDQGPWPECGGGLASWGMSFDQWQTGSEKIWWIIYLPFSIHMAHWHMSCVTKQLAVFPGKTVATSAPHVMCFPSFLAFFPNFPCFF